MSDTTEQMSLNDMTSDKGRSQYKAGLRDSFSIGQQSRELGCKSTLSKAMQVTAAESVVSAIDIFVSLKSYVRIYTLWTTRR